MTLHKIRLLLFLFLSPSLFSFFHKIALFCKISIEGFPFIFLWMVPKVKYFYRHTLKDIHNYLTVFQGGEKGYPKNDLWHTIEKRWGSLSLKWHRLWTIPFTHSCYMINLGIYLIQKLFHHMFAWAKITQESDALKLRSSSNLRKFICNVRKIM